MGARRASARICICICVYDFGCALASFRRRFMTLLRERRVFFLPRVTELGGSAIRWGGLWLELLFSCGNERARFCEKVAHSVAEWRGSARLLVAAPK